MILTFARSLPRMGLRPFSTAPFKTTMCLTTKQVKACLPRILKKGGSIDFPPDSLKDPIWLHEHFRRFQGDLDILIKFGDSKEFRTINTPSLKDIPHPGTDPGTEGTLLKEVKVADLGLELLMRLIALSRSHYAITISNSPVAKPLVPSTSLRRRCNQIKDL